MAKTPYDKIRNAFDSERVGSTTIDAIDEMDVDAIRDLADKLTAVVEAAEEARDAVQCKLDADTTEDRTDARDTALDAMDQLVNAMNDLPGDDDSLLEMAIQFD